MSLFHEETLDLFRSDWALLAAGDAADYNAMTIGWGGLGTLWNKRVATVYVKPVRHTFGYMEKNDYFTVGFYPPENRQDLTVMGTLSGRDGDKAAQTSLTLVPLAHGVTFAQAEATLVCRKLYAADLDPACIPQEFVERYYAEEAPHRMYIGEVVEIIRK